MCGIDKKITFWTMKAAQRDSLKSLCNHDQTYHGAESCAGK